MPPHVLLSARLRYEEYADDLVPDVDRPDARPWPVRADRGMSAFKLRGPCHTARGFASQTASSETIDAELWKNEMAGNMKKRIPRRT
jgi:hypothetical protein